MIFGKRTPKTKKSDLHPLELSVLEHVIENSAKPQLLQNQLKFLTHKKRIKYPKSSVTEFYPERMGTIPEDLLISKKDEFRLANVTVDCGNNSYYCQVHMVSGQLFDLSFKPVPSTQELKLEPSEFRKLHIESI